ncbi:MAG: glutamate 5-kinase [Vampirovibrionales bacterium]|nr:glutamate 5-kinase [Vampirovibrionales bacterium]
MTQQGIEQAMAKNASKSIQRVVIKLGTQVLVETARTENSSAHHETDPQPLGETLSDGPSRITAGSSNIRLDLASQPRMRRFVADCAELVKSGKEVVIVSSGAVGLGRQQLVKKLGLIHPLSLAEKQACAAVGQNLLMDAYRTLFAEQGLITGQVLLTALDFSDRRHYLNLRRTLEMLLRLGVIPIINENDPVSTMELEEDGYAKAFGDNDRLSAIVAGKMDADLLVILTNVDGIYTENPALNPDAKRIAVIEGLEELNNIDTLGKSTMGRGGMASKLEAAKIAAISGVQTLVVSGLGERPLSPLFSKTDAEISPESGTLILPKTASMTGKKRWIGTASGYNGIVVINDGAAKALVEKQASLLPVGVVSVQGDFEDGQVVSIHDERGMELGRGVTYFSAQDIDRVKGLHSDKINEILDSKYIKAAYKEVIHRDNLVIFQQYGI